MILTKKDTGILPCHKCNIKNWDFLYHIWYIEINQTDEYNGYLCKDCLHTVLDEWSGKCRKISIYLISN